MATMGLYRTVSEIDRDFSRQSQIPPRVFRAPLTGFPLELCIDARSQKTSMMGLSDGRKSFKVVLAV